MLKNDCLSTLVLASTFGFRSCISCHPGNPWCNFLMIMACTNSNGNPVSRFRPLSMYLHCKMSRFTAYRPILSLDYKLQQRVILRWDHTNEIHATHCGQLTGQQKARLSRFRLAWHLSNDGLHAVPRPLMRQFSLNHLSG